MSDIQRVGWWEWVLLPGVCGTPLKAKCDTGAAVSALHAENLEVRHVGDMQVARFQITPGSATIELPIIKNSQIRSSNGEAQLRPVVLIPIDFAGRVFAIEVTLTDRTPMAYPMLLGRSALAGRFTVDPAESRLHRKPRARRVP